MSNKKQSVSFGGAPVILHGSTYPEFSQRVDGDFILVETNVRYLVDGEVYLFPTTFNFSKETGNVKDQIAELMAIQVMNYTKPGGLKMKYQPDSFKNQIVKSDDQSTDGIILGKLLEQS